MNTESLVFGVKEIFIIVFSFLFLFLITGGIYKHLGNAGDRGKLFRLYSFELDTAEARDIIIHKNSYCENEQIVLDHFSSVVKREFENVDSEEKSGAKAATDTTNILVMNIYARAVTAKPCVRIAPRVIEEPFSVNGALPVVVYLSVENGLYVD